MSDWNTKDLEWDFSWLDGMDRSCPFCGEELDVKPGETAPDVARAKCGCGFNATFTPPDDISPLKGVIKEIRL